MNKSDIIKEIRKFVDPGVTPGQAFDAILALRSARLSYADLVAAMTDSPAPNVKDADLAKLDTGLEYNDDTPMPFGKWKGDPLGKVPVGYFHWLWGERPMHDRKLEAYVEKNIPAFKIEDPDLIWK